MARESIAKCIDHTLLRPEATRDDVVGLCREATEYGFAAACVNPCYVATAAELLKESEVKVCTVIGFPLGATTTPVKAFEARDAVANGADELDMVINIGALKAKDDESVRKDIEAVVAAASGRIVKCILETGLLTDEEKARAATLVKEAGAHYVKTCTGFSGGGATPQDVALIRKTIGPGFGVKASGKISDYGTARSLLEAGATRIGASKGVAIAEGEPKEN